ncbi:hypothetical protein HA402_002728 [Bradysia odoriphaga]|nr:hypothetical protein HA402_002728 [Bradysia odoriphaga]
MESRRNKRRSTTKGNDKSKKSKTANVSSDDESTEENNTISEPESDNTDAASSNKKNNVTKNGGDCADSDDEALINVAKPSKTSKSRHEKSGNDEPAVTDAQAKKADENPDCAPKPKRKKKRKRKSRETEDRWEDSDTDMESRYLKVKDIFKMSDIDDGSDDGSSDSDVEWEVQQIVGVKKVKGESRQYLIRWKGYGARHDTWESEERLNCPDLIKKFNGEVKSNETQSGEQTVKPKTSTGRHIKRSGKKRN